MHAVYPLNENLSSMFSRRLLVVVGGFFLFLSCLSCSTFQMNFKHFSTTACRNSGFLCIQYSRKAACQQTFFYKNLQMLLQVFFVSQKSGILKQQKKSKKQLKNNSKKQNPRRSFSQSITRARGKPRTRLVKEKEYHLYSFFYLPPLQFIRGVGRKAVTD